MEEIRTNERYGAPELKRDFNRNLLMGLGISVLLHGLVIGYYLLSDEKVGWPPPSIRLADIPTPRTDTTWMAITLDDPKKQSADPEGGGDPDSKEPIGLAQRGHKDAVPDRTRDNVDKTRSVKIENPTNVRPTDKEPKSPNLAGDTKDTSKNTGVTGTKGQNVDGRGTKPAGGSGGVGIGFADGMGGRGWAVRPGKQYPSGSNATGTVVLRFTVLPNGKIMNITPVKRADAALVRAAISNLSRAKARPLPPDAPQIAQTATIPFNFTLK